MPPTMVAFATHHEQLHGLVAGTGLELKVPRPVTPALAAGKGPIGRRRLAPQVPVRLTSFHGFLSYSLAFGLLACCRHCLCWESRYSSSWQYA